jgi:SAM-dependent methyltransferase
MSGSLDRQDAPLNADASVVEGFGDEWERFDQSDVPEEELRTLFSYYFEIFPWGDLPPGAEGFDLGCGSGRWAQLVAPRVGRLNLVDASDKALAVARRKLAKAANVTFTQATVSEPFLPPGSQDFGYSLGVLHHVPDTLDGLRACVDKLKPGAPFLVYLYYRFDNRPLWFRLVWRASDLVRKIVSRLPHGLRYAVSQLLAITVYWPLARLALLLEKLGISPTFLPLSHYRDKSFYTMRTDALDRFGTQLEKRFTRSEIAAMMEAAGLVDIRFSENEPYWCAVGRKKG